MEFPLTMLPNCPAFPYTGDGSIDSIIGYNEILVLKHKSCREDLDILKQYVIERNESNK